MDFDLSPEQKMLKEQARRLLDEHASPQHVRSFLEDPQQATERTLLDVFAEQGWFGAAIPEAYGGLGLSPVDTCVIAEEFGRSLAPGSFSSTVYLFAEAIRLSDDQQLKQDLLPRVAAGEIVGCFAHADLPPDRTCVVREGRLHGDKAPVLDGMSAGFAIVAARNEGSGSTGLFLADLDQEQVSRSPVRTIDPTRSAARLTFDGAEAQRLSIDRPDPVEELRARAAVYFAFEQIGGADRCLEMARDYALERKTFGAPIGRNQAIKHKLADLFVANEIARSNAYFAASALEAGSGRLAAAAAAARIAACDAYWLAAKENIQTHGGIGVTWEMDCHLHYRRAHLLSLVVGSPDHWKRVLADELVREWRNGRAAA